MVDKLYLSVYIAPAFSSFVKKAGSIRPLAFFLTGMLPVILSFRTGSRGAI